MACAYWPVPTTSQLQPTRQNKNYATELTPTKGLFSLPSSCITLLLLSIMSLDERFKKAVWLVRNGPPKESSNETKLNFYKYFKQATEGDVKGGQV